MNNWTGPTVKQLWNYAMHLFLLNMFIDHHTVKSHLLMHVYNTDTIYELKSGQKRLDIFTFTVPIYLIKIKDKL